MPRQFCECSTRLVDDRCPRCDEVRAMMRQASAARARQRAEAVDARRIDIDRAAVAAAAARIDPRQARHRARQSARALRGYARRAP